MQRLGCQSLQRRRSAVLASLLAVVLLLSPKALQTLFVGFGRHPADGPTSRIGGDRTCQTACHAQLPDDLLAQSLEEVALDVRELFVSNANIFVVGPDTESYLDEMRTISDMLNYTFSEYTFTDVAGAMDVLDKLEQFVVVPPVISVQRWPWGLLKQGIVVWLDIDGNEQLDVNEQHRQWRKKFPKKKTFGPSVRAIDRGHGDLEPPGDPVDMWREADVQVDLLNGKDIELKKLTMGTMIETILKNPPLWRQWMQQAKARGSVPAEYETPFEVRRREHSFGFSSRLQKLITAR